MPVVFVFCQLVNKQGGITCKPESQFGKHYPMCHCPALLFHLLPYKDENKYMNLLTLKGSFHRFGTLKDENVIRYDTCNDVKP